MKDWIQFFIAALGVLAIMLIGREERYRKWGYLLGLVGQPFWVWSSYAAGQWGILVLSLLYLFCWGQGVWHYWINTIPGGRKNEV